MMSWTRTGPTEPDAAGTGRVAVITGASSGIGLACARRLTSAGWRVYGTSRSAPEVHDPARASATDAGILIRADVTDDESVRRAVEVVLRYEGHIDAAICNAGITIAGALEELSTDEVRRQIDTNLIGVIRMCREVLPAMRRARRGHLVVIGSLGGVVGLPFQSVYSASKFAVDGLLEALHFEVAPFGVKTVLIQPGNFRTAFTDHRRIAKAARPQSAYAGPFSRALAQTERDEREASPPDAVADLVAEVVATPNPRLRYAVGAWHERLLVPAKRLLPARLFLRGIKPFLGV